MGRERMIKATVANSLGWVENEERQVDRVTALGFATRKNQLGAAIVHAEALDADSMRKVVLMVSRAIIRQHRVARSLGERIAVAALREHMAPRCRSCGGIPYIEARVAQVCPTCKGTGIHRYSDAERAQMIGVGRCPTKVYESALGEIRDHLGRAVGGADSRLGD